MSELCPTVRPMNEHEAVERTRRHYDAVAELYDSMVRQGDDDAGALTRAMINAFASLVLAGGSDSAVLDAGCGPGQWVDHLDRNGIRAYGIDVSPAMIAIARQYRPDLPFEVESMLQLKAPDRSIAGILAHFSLIHTPPDLLPAVLVEFARVIEPGGPLLIAAQISDSPGDEGWTPYDHRASPAYVWSLDALTERLRAHDFTELGRMRIAAPAQGKPSAGYLLARHNAYGSAQI
jgi:ubiquinone/menaquinone biosynthesis C-methylase UbiE